ncbi:c-type cytochrome [Pseudomonas sp.]|uniref:SorU family sulfite dehydrogenase c-type cytochrome subunit n=1 Tax=Pseudomonas sp. TaxID=306 RepID=UPI00299D5974|nr:c-type cytochrome [Pseudomonas sp.]MDX1370171.1 c-type cytochrome [Pseudomonas sp.]MDX1726171.1 c-type cytochrome [Pseudomonas sp.]
MPSALWWLEPMRGLGFALVGLLAMAQASAGDTRLALGRQVFTEQAQPSCSLCHSLREAGASGIIGPDLDQLKPSVERVAAAVQGGVGVMPSFAASLSAEQIEAVAHYVAEMAGQ